MLQKISLVAVLFGLSLSPLLPVLHASETRQADLQSTTTSGISVEIYSQLSPLEINRIHGWKLVIHDAAGNPLSGAELTLTGGMPDHDHGIPTLPQLTEQADAGVYSLQGIRFHMPGKWQIILSINHAGENEPVVIDFQL
ncbi:MAG: FixH family protein [Gammaproteobacteria bacterium]|nr:FixH family protein [Gammaproteobacteria bacterium]MDP6651671.1 FixH family protein [Gammaproteobacteria bacterium]